MCCISLPPGVPIRLEVGPKDVKADGFVAVRRDTGDKIKMSRATAADEITKLLTTIQVWSLTQFFMLQLSFS